MYMQEVCNYFKYEELKDESWSKRKKEDIKEEWVECNDILNLYPLYEFIYSLIENKDKEKDDEE